MSWKFPESNNSFKFVGISALKCANCLVFFPSLLDIGPKNMNLRENSLRTIGYNPIKYNLIENSALRTGKCPVSYWDCKIASSPIRFFVYVLINGIIP